MQDKLTDILEEIIGPYVGKLSSGCPLKSKINPRYFR